MVGCSIYGVKYPAADKDMLKRVQVKQD